MFKKLSCGLAAVALAATSTMASANFPERNIETIFPWGPGTAFASTQVITEAMSKELDTSISVVSTPGAAGIKAFKTALRKPANGYTIIDGWIAPLVLQPNAGNADWTHSDFIPLWSAISTPFALVSRKGETRWKDFDGLVEYMKKNPGKLRYSSGSYGNLPHMIMARVMQTQDVYARNIPYPQDGDAFKDLKSGLLDFTFNNPSTYRANKDSFKVMAVLNDNREVAKMFDNGPLVKDFGVDMGLTGLSPSGWNWFVLKKDTPPEVVETLRKAMENALKKEEVQKKLTDMGFFPTMYGPESYETIVSDVSKQLKVAQDAIAWEKEQFKKK